MKRLNVVDLNTPQYYNKMWGENTFHYDPTRLQALAKHIKEGDKVIELGAGVCSTVQYAYETELVDAVYTALDYSPKAKDVVLERIAKIRLNGSSFEYIVGDVRATKLQAKSFDVVIAGEVIEHMEKPLMLVREMARLCKPGGWMTISTVDTNCENAKKMHYPEHLWEFDSQDLIDLFAPYGETFYYTFGDYHMIDCKRAA